MGDEQQNHVVFAAMVEGLIRALKDKLDDKTHARFAELGISLKPPFKPSYPRAAWTKVAHLAGEVLTPGAPLEQQRFNLGSRFIYGYSETLVGGALIAMMRVLGPKKAMQRLGKSFKTGNNYSKAELREEGGALYLDVLEAPFPEWYQGVIQATLQITGAKDIKVELVHDERPAKITYKVQFT